MIDIKKVLDAAIKYDEVKRSESKAINTNERLTVLVKHYGIEAVSAASGLMVSSLVQYTTKKSAPKCSESTVLKAEHILSQF